MNLRLALGLMVCVFLAGCEIPAQTFWSPDGTKAAYAAPSDKDSPAMMIDESGKVLANLGESSGGFAWSADSKRLYFTRSGRDTDTKIELKGEWLNVSPEEIPAAENNEDNPFTICVYENNKATPLFTIDRGPAWYMAISPDQNWLAVAATAVSGKEANINALYAYCIASKRVYPLSVGGPVGFCFTGPNRLAFIEPEKVKKDNSPGFGQLVEVQLVDKAEKPERHGLQVVIIFGASWLQAAGEDILFSSIAYSFPGPVPKDAADLPSKIFRYSRAQNTVKPLVDDAFEYFAVSPDGKRVLCATPAKGANDTKPTKLSVLDLATGAVHPLRDLNSTVKVGAEQFQGMPAYATWRNNEQFTFTAPIDPNKPPTVQDGRFPVDLVLYGLSADYKVTPIRTLSESWPAEVKPSIKKENK